MRLVPRKCSWDTGTDSYFCPGVHKLAREDNECENCHVAMKGEFAGRHLMVMHSMGEVDRALLCDACVEKYREWIALTLLVPEAI